MKFLRIFKSSMFGLLSVMSVNCTAQSDGYRFYASVDSFARTIKYKGSLDSLATSLTGPYPTQLFKVRAIFIWITENIRYDVKYYNRYNYKGKEPKTFKCKEDEDCEAKEMAWETRYIDRVVKKKLAVCDGYARLFKKLCDIAGLKSEVIAGYVRTEAYQVGTPGTLNHAWNSVLIDSAYYLLDPTWAAGGCAKNDDGKLLYYEKGFDDYYWLTPARDFARNHFPQDAKWTLIPNYTKDNFAANPYYKPSEIKYIKLIAPNSGIINVKKGDTIRFKIDYPITFEKLQINSNVFRNPDIWLVEKIKRKKIRRLDTLAVKQQQYVPYRLDASICEFEYVVKDNSLYFLDILFDRKQIMRFNVHVTRN